MTAISRTGAAFLAALTLTAFAAPAASAQSWSQMRRIAAACKPDYQRLCPGVQRGGGRILACLQANEANLSPDCRAVLPEAQAMRQQQQQSVADQ